MEFSILTVFCGLGTMIFLAGCEPKTIHRENGQALEQTSAQVLPLVGGKFDESFGSDCFCQYQRLTAPEDKKDILAERGPGHSQIILNGEEKLLSDISEKGDVTQYQLDQFKVVLKTGPWKRQDSEHGYYPKAKITISQAGGPEIVIPVRGTCYCIGN